MDQALAYSLSDDDLRRLNPHTKLLLYEDVKNFPTIDHLLHPYNCAIILYEWKRTKDASIGHYIAVLKLPDGTIEHFDSYGIKPDRELKQIKDKSDAYKKMTGQDQQYLLKLYIKSPRPISYNQYKLQSINDGISTCGRFSALRTIFKNLSLEQFKDLFMGKRNTPDEIAVMMTQKNIL